MGHGLNVAPEFWLWKSRSATGSWQAYFTVLGSSSNRLNLNTDGAVSSSYPGSATNSIINLSDGPTAAWGGTNVIYAFAPVAGYSAFGSYEGNGSDDGPFVFTGMRPRWLLVKRSSGTGNWILVDTARSSFNTADEVLIPNSSTTEQDLSAYTPFDILSNGFKLRDGTDLTGTTNINVSGSTYIYAAFASNPFQANGGLAR